MEEHSLNTAKHLYISEKAWAKLAKHFAILLSDKDTEILMQLQGFVDTWRDLVEEFNLTLKQRDVETDEELCAVRAGIQAWVIEFQKRFL